LQKLLELRAYFSELFEEKKRLLRYYRRIDKFNNESPHRSPNGNQYPYPSSAPPNSSPLLLEDINRRPPAAEVMANYPCDPLPHLPPSAVPVPFNALRPQCGYVVVGGELLIICDDWAIVSLEPEPDLTHFQGMSQLIRAQFEQRGFRIRQISRCGMGTTLVCFMDAVDRDNAISQSPYFIGETVLRVIPQNEGRNWRSASFTHDFWCMLINYPLECWDVDTIVNTMAPYGRFLVWNRQDSNKARIFVKIRAYDINRIPGSIVVLHSSNSLGDGNSWSCPCILFNPRMLGAGPGDEDPLPPNGGSPHPLPIVFDDFDVWHAQNEGAPAAPGNVAPAEPADGDPAPMTPDNSPVHHMENVAAMDEENLLNLEDFATAGGANEFQVPVSDVNLATAPDVDNAADDHDPLEETTQAQFS
jgi:hypothetical protein